MLFIKFQFVLMYEYYFALKCLQLIYYNFLFVFQALEFANNSEIVCQQNFRNSKIDRIIDRIFKLNVGLIPYKKISTKYAFNTAFKSGLGSGFY